MGRHLRVGALVVSSVAIASAQGQDSPRVARALERARFMATHLLGDDASGTSQVRR